MRKYIASALLIILFLTGIFSFKNNSSKLGGRLTYNLDNTTADKFTVYIYLTDKGPNAESKLLQPLNIVSQKSLERRAKVLPQNQLVDYTDIPLYENYVSSLSGNVLKIRHELKWFNAVSAEVSRAQISHLTDIDFVKQIEVVETFKARKDDPELNIQDNMLSSIESDNPDLDSINYGTSLKQNSLIKVNLVHNEGISGQGVIVANFDAGYSNLSHEAFTTLPTKILKKKDFQTNDTVNLANHSHGQATFSLVGAYKPGSLIGPAFKSSFILCRTEVDPGETPVEMDHWIAASQWVDSLGADVITSSLSYLGFDNPYPSYTWQQMNGNTMPITVGADLAVKKGIIVCNSAGNSGYNATQNTLGGPADGDSVITIGATDSNGVRSSYSSVGPTTDVPARFKPDLMAQGSLNKVASSTGYNNYGSGTSWSCPMAAGVAALVLSSNKSLTPIQIRGILRKFANNSASPNNTVGWGLIDAKASVDSARKMDNTLPVITHTQQGNTSNTGVISVKAKITDNGIIRMWTNQMPLVWYRKYLSGSWTTFTSVTPNIARNDSFFYQIPGSSPGTSVEYYFAAQDIALPTPKMVTLPAGGSGVTPPGTTAPATRFSFLITGVNNNTSGIPGSFKLYNNDPNPFNPTTSIKFDLPQNTFVKINVFDITGRLIKNLISQNMNAGSYQITFDGSGLSTGLYFCQMSASDFYDVTKMLLIK